MPAYYRLAREQLQPIPGVLALHLAVPKFKNPLAKHPQLDYHFAENPQDTRAIQTHSF